MRVHVAVHNRPYAKGKAGILMGRVVEYPRCVGYGNTREEMFADIAERVKDYIENDKRPVDKIPTMVTLNLPYDNPRL